MFKRLLCAGIVSCALIASSSAFQREAFNDCLYAPEGAEPESIVTACSVAIQFGNNFASRVKNLLFEARALAYLQTGDVRRALADFDESIKLDPKNSNPYYSKAIIFFNRLEYGLALENLSQSIALGSDTDASAAERYNFRAWVLYKIDRPDEGLPDAKRAIELKPDFAEAYDTRAHIYEALDKKHSSAGYMTWCGHFRDNAKGDFEKALSLKPDIQESIEGLKRLETAPECKSPL